jgi:hypothetical protein
MLGLVSIPAGNADGRLAKNFIDLNPARQPD